VGFNFLHSITDVTYRRRMERRGRGFLAGWGGQSRRRAGCQPRANRPCLAQAQSRRRRAIVGASKTAHIDDAIASLVIELSDEEVARLELPHRPRHDFQGISDPRELARISAQIGITAET
jgi:hypothetical protein